ncbi:hypothetical protein [Enterobacter mori]|uniref:hypothetical protein n=1 Tax=Enterobacter mori TaxID=539813 RepID=UPI002A7F9A4D|nr:hypothetical protein [Enterobacter mori]
MRFIAAAFAAAAAGSSALSRGAFHFGLRIFTRPVIIPGARIISPTETLIVVLTKSAPLPEADERHLWPAFFHLISERRPQHVFGEQVAAGNANAWFDLVQADLEGMDYAFGLVPFTPASIGAPHIRERAYWVAHAISRRYDGRTEISGQKARPGAGAAISDRVDGMAYSNHRISDEGETLRTGGDAVLDGCGINRMADTEGKGFPHGRSGAALSFFTETDGKAFPTRPLEVNGFWRDADWLFCRDGKWRPVEPCHQRCKTDPPQRLKIDPGVNLLL